MFSSSSPRYHVKVTCTPPLCSEVGWARFKLEQQPSMSLFGHSEMGGTTLLSTARELLFQRMLSGATGVPPPRTRDHIRKMIPILECGTPMLKERWIGHPSIPPRVFGPNQYLVTQPVWMTKLKLTSKLLPANSISKLVPRET